MALGIVHDARAACSKRSQSHGEHRQTGIRETVRLSYGMCLSVQRRTCGQEMPSIRPRLRYAVAAGAPSFVQLQPVLNSLHRLCLRLDSATQSVPHAAAESD